MNRIQIILFPAILLGIFVIILFASLADTSEAVQASADLDEPTQSPSSAPAQPSQEPTIHSTSSQPTGSCSISKRFPASIRQWCSLIEKYALPVKLEPNLIAAVMLQESGGNPKAYSQSGAVGLMQVMPRDGLAASFKCASGPCFASRPSMAQLYDPEYNISYGVRMLAALVQKTGGLRDALRSYGPINVGYYYADKVLKIYDNYQ